MTFMSHPDPTAATAANAPVPTPSAASDHDLRILVDVKRHVYGDLVVLEDVSFEVGPGEVVCIIGPSGCGKSTLLSMIGGLLQPHEGTVTYRGDPPKGCLNPFTYVFQDFSLLPWFTVGQNIAFPLRHHGLSKAELDQRVRDAAQRTNLDQFIDAYPKQLSGGMKQRVGIARALAVSPAVLLMDEPLSALDAQTRDLLMDDFLALWIEERITGVYVTHNLDEAVRLAHRIVVLSRRPGRIKEILSVDMPQMERDKPENAAALASLRDRLWKLIRDEAIDAEQETADF